MDAPAAGEEGSQPRRFGQIDAEAVSAALVAPCHFGAGMAELLLNIALIHLGVAGETRA